MSDSSISSHSRLAAGDPTAAGPHGPTDLFADLTPLPPRSALRQAILQACRLPEPQALPPLLALAAQPPAGVARSQAMARRLIQGLREGRHQASGKSDRVQGLLQEFSLSSQEGLALMCLAEALLRIPDAATRDALIRDKICDGDWQEHLGRKQSFFVNAASLGLWLTGKSLARSERRGLPANLKRILTRGAEPMVRKAMDIAMRMMGEQFVAGETIAQALQHASALEARGFRYSYDMLGEAALTADDAGRYLASYEQAIHAIGRAAGGRGIYDGPGISIKLSALHPRYSRAQFERVQAELYPVLLGLARLARAYNIGLNIDAEEADRLELSLDLLERLCFEPELAGWEGLGFVVQAYQKRCPFVVDHLLDLAQRSERRLMVRLVKGAYWDSEIKRAQVDGLEGYPVFTRKAYTDVSYLACARKLLAAPRHLYPQFATHNAHTLAAIHEMAGPDRYFPGQYEFQCLHGMGEPLYEQVVGGAAGAEARPCRIYAPVGTYETLLAYLVRRLLENGANTSFVNRVADPAVPIADLIQDPVAQVAAMSAADGYPGAPNPHIPLPAGLYGVARDNSRGLDLSSEGVLQMLGAGLHGATGVPAQAGPLLAVAAESGGQAATRIVNPANHQDILGTLQEASRAEVEAAIETAARHTGAWADVAPARRSLVLLRTGDLLQADMVPLIGLLMREVGKTCANAVAEVREAIDFLRYYASQVEASFRNETHRPLGPVVCISPWNFPLAIFMGQVAAALAAGNTVLAKPAEQTTLIAREAVQRLWAAGVPREAVQLVSGRGSVVGPWLVADARVQGVMFTGSTAVARQLQGMLASRLGPAGRPVPLVAETGGQNAMIVDSSALTEQVVQDVIQSAFDSAGQRCSALRVLCVQEEAADRLLTMLKGAMAELRLGDPAELRTDVGPVIDRRAQDAIDQHIQRMQARGCRVHALNLEGSAALQAALAQGTFVPPTLIEIGSVSELTKEVFGPVLHVMRYARDDLDTVLEQIRDTGYGLTLGLHTRIDDTTDHVLARAHVGNVYVNRNMVGAVVGVQPFGGEGLSGTGPKAGGPLYLLRLLAEAPGGALEHPYGVLAAARMEDEPVPGAGNIAGEQEAAAAYAALRQWLAGQPGASGIVMPPFLPSACHGLAGPTGERNLYQILPREAVLCLASGDRGLLAQLAAILAVGARAVWDGQDGTAAALHSRLPALVRQRVVLSADCGHEALDYALHEGSEASRLAVQAMLAGRDGRIVPLAATTADGPPVPLERLVIERAISINTAAAGGNASLMTMPEEGA